MKRCFAIVFYISIFVFFPTQLSAGSPTKTVIVTAQGIGETVNSALLEARKNAVRKAFGEIIDSQTEIKNDNLEESTISASNAFILNEENISDPQFNQKNKLYTVNLKFTIASDRVKSHINRFRTTSTSINANENISTVEKQTENVCNLLTWWHNESIKAFSFKNWELSAIQNKLSFKATFICDNQKLQEMQKHAIEILEKNSYSPLKDNTIKRRIRNINLGPLDFTYLESHCIIINSIILENKKLKFTDQNISHLSSSLGKLQLFISLTLNTGEELIIWNNKPNQLYLQPVNYGWNPITKDYSFELISNYNEININSTLHPNLYCVLLPNISTLKECSDISKYAKKIEINNLLPKLTMIKFCLKGNNTNIVATFPIDKKLQNDLILQNESSLKRADDIAHIVHHTGRESFKTLIPMVTDYQLITKNNVYTSTPNYAIRVNFIIKSDRRAQVQLLRKLIKQLNSLGIPQYNDRGKRLSVNLLSKQYKYFLDRNIIDNIEESIRKIKYFVVLKCKNSRDEVLQEKDFEIGTAIKDRVFSSTPYGLFFHCTENQSHVTDIIFDLPEDIKYVKTIECNIEERIAP